MSKSFLKVSEAYSKLGLSEGANWIRKSELIATGKCNTTKLVKYGNNDFMVDDDIVIGSLMMTSKIIYDWSLMCLDFKAKVPSINSRTYNCTFVFMNPPNISGGMFLGSITFNKIIASISSSSFTFGNSLLSISKNSKTILFTSSFPITEGNKFNIGIVKIIFDDDTYIYLNFVLRVGVETIVKIKFNDGMINGRCGYYNGEQGTLKPYYLYPTFDELQALIYSDINYPYKVVLNQYLRSLVPGAYNQVLFFFEDDDYYSWFTFKSTSGNDFNYLSVTNSMLGDRISTGWEGYMAIFYQYTINPG